jgi:hypothetical protein
MAVMGIAHFPRMRNALIKIAKFLKNLTPFGSGRWCTDTYKYRRLGAGLESWLFSVSERDIPGGELMPDLNDLSEFPPIRTFKDL